MEVSAAIRRSIECAVLAGRLESAALKYEDKTAASLRRAAAKFRAGAREALADVRVEAADLATESAASSLRGLAQ